MILSRRNLLLSGAAALAAPALIRRGYAQNGPLPVGVISSMSGVFANVGEQVAVGAEMAFEHFGEAGGRPLEYVLLDDHGDTGRSVRLVRDAMEQRGIMHFVGTTNSAIALAVAAEVHANGGLNINLAGADEMTGSQCNRSSFRWPVATFSAANATVRPFVDIYPDANRWYTITGQYVFGESLLRNTVNVLTELGKEHVGNSYHAIAEREYSGYIAAAAAANPDVLAICNFGNQTLDVLRQAISFGLHRRMKILVVWSTALDQFESWGPGIIEDIYFGANYWHDVDAPGNKRFRDAFEPQFNRVPNYLNATGWAVTQILVEGINKAGTAEIDPLIEAMRGLEYEGVTGPERIRPEDHQVVKPYYFMRGKSADQMSDPNDYVEIISEEIALIPPDQTGCNMT